jgi:hypothetical protein
MNGSEEIKAAHVALSPLDWEFRQIACEDSELLSRSTFAILDEDHDLLTYRLQSWPTFLGAAKLEEIRRAGLAVHRLLRRIPERIFDNNAERISEFYGLDDPVRTQFLIEEPNCIAGAVSRGDFIDTASGFRCIEFNMGANLGGWETGILAEMLLAIPPIGRFIRERGLRLSITDTVHALCDHIIDEAESKGIARDGELNVAFTFSQELLTTRAPTFAAHMERALRDRLLRRRPDLTGRVIACCEDFTCCDGSLFHGAIPIHAVVEIDAPGTHFEVYKAMKGGRALLYNGPMNFMLTSKRNIALLSEHRDSERFTAEERALIAAYIPWTTRVLPHHIDFRGRRVYLPDLLARERESLVLKDSLSAGGAGVRLGRFTPQAEWEETIDLALDRGDWLVQEAIESLPYLYQNGELGCSPHNVIWGPFVFGDRYGGVVLRMQPKADKGAVNLSLTATEGIVFEV